MANVIDKGSTFVGKDELNVFSLPATQIAAERSRFMTIYPKNAVPEIDTSSPITFEISGLPDFLDLSKNFLKVKFQIKKEDGEDIGNDDNVAAINYIANTFISQLKIFINNKLISDSADTYMYRSYIETLVNYSEKRKRSNLQLAGWYQDELGINQTTVDNANNKGFVKMKGINQDSATFEVLAPLHTDLFNQPTTM